MSKNKIFYLYHAAGALGTKVNDEQYHTSISNCPVRKFQIVQFVPREHEINHDFTAKPFGKHHRLG
jgi:hypothetical protein